VRNADAKAPAGRMSDRAHGGWGWGCARHTNLPVVVFADSKTPRRSSVLSVRTGFDRAGRVRRSGGCQRAAAGQGLGRASLNAGVANDGCANLSWNAPRSSALALSCCVSSLSKLYSTRLESMLPLANRMADPAWSGGAGR